MTKRSRFGGVRKLPSGRWQARWQDASGRTQNAPSTFATKTAAQAYLATVETDMRRGDYIDPRLARSTFAEWAAEWRASTVHLKPRTALRYGQSLDNQVLPFFGTSPVNSIDVADVRRFVAEQIAAGYAPGSIRAAKQVARSVLGLAREAGAIKANPCDGVKVPRSPRDEPVFLSAAEVERLAQSIDPRFATFVRFAAYTGLRYGELAALRVGRIDLLRGVAEVAESVGDVNGKLVYGPTKTYQKRSVPLPRFLRDELGAHLAGRELSADSLVFTAADGGPLRHANFLRRIYKPAVIRAGLDARLRIHDLRHTCAALLIAEGAHVLSVSKRLGHSSIAVTMDTYGHLLPALEEALTDRLDDAYRAAASTNGPAVVARRA